MTFFEKIQAKFETYSGKVQSFWFRLIHRFSPGYFQIEVNKPSIFPLGYAFPDELFQTTIPAKKQLWAEVIPGLKETYRFSDEDSYYQMYSDARFAYTWKKGGWDCLRHYEILASGTIPVFPDLAGCPVDTLTHLPKELILLANKELLPWKDKPEYHSKYQKYAVAILEHAKEKASFSAMSEDFLKNLGAQPSQKILFLNCDSNVNYSRELLFIGLSRTQESHKGLCHAYPKLDYLYDNFPLEKADKCYGKGFGYTRRLSHNPNSEDLPSTAEEVENSITQGFWDFIVYGKMGLDEGQLGTAPTCPFWKTVAKVYSKNQIAFVYGGDHIQNLQDMGCAHSRHLAYHAKLGKCFVRELKLN